MSSPRALLHATSVCEGERAVIILGAAGSGKSTLALQMIALGAELVADDRTEVYIEKDQLLATCPKTIAGRIEARGIGILTLPNRVSAPIAFAVTLDALEIDRLPGQQTMAILDRKIRLLRKVQSPGFAASLILALRHGLPQ